MNILSAENISKSLGERVIFDKCTLGLNQGDKIALVGVNGTGKTTLLKILAGLEPPDSGVVSIRKEIKLGYLFQEPDFNEQANVLDNVLTGDLPQVRLIRRYELLTFAEQNVDEKELSTLIEDINACNAWDFEREVHEVLGKLGIGHLLTKPISLLSGGQRKRVAMARLLINKPDVLLLDEPTNHLDIDTIEWLENIIAKNFKTLIMVSHDRYFLDAICNVVVEIDNGNVLKIKGNYAHFLEKKAQLIEVEDARHAKLKNLMRKELEWVRRQPKARGTKSRSRLDAFNVLKEEVGNKRIEEELDLPFKAHRQGSKIVELRRVSKNYDQQVILKQFSYNFQKGENVGIIGKNGVGKTTLIRIITGEETPDTGDVVIGETTLIGYYRQEIPNFDPEKRLLDYVKSIAENIELENGQNMSASAFLTYFLFKPAQHYTPLGKLSGGERKRLQLISILIKNPNFLILDEPTNDLDINTLNVLEDYLIRFSGTALIVSHDRYFMDKVADHLLIFEGDGVVNDFNGNYSDYRLTIAGKKSVVEPKTDKLESTKIIVPFPTTDAKNVKRRKLNYKEAKELEEILQQIPTLEAEQQELENFLSSAGSDFEKIVAKSDRLREIKEQIETLTLRWLELEEFSK
jgi:ATP-binding cassette subfamily F protein uup